MSDPNTWPSEAWQRIEELEAELQALREAAQAVVNSGEHRAAVLRCEASYQINSLAALLEQREIVYPDDIPVDRAGRPMFNRYGDKLDVEDR